MTTSPTIDLTLDEIRVVTGWAARSAGHASGAAYLHPLAQATQVRHVLGSAAPIDHKQRRDQIVDRERRFTRKRAQRRRAPQPTRAAG